MSLSGRENQSEDKATSSPQSSRNVRTREAKMYPEMEAFVEAFIDMTQGINRNCDPFSQWYISSDARGSGFKTALHNTNIRNAISQMNVVTPAMENNSVSNEFYNNIQGFLKELNQADSNKEIKKPVIRDLSKFILDALSYCFIQIEVELKTNEEKIKHYTMLRNVCLLIISSRKWSAGTESWCDLFNSASRKFTANIHLLIVELAKKIETLKNNSRPDELREQLIALETNAHTFLNVSKFLLLKLISNETVPTNIFSHPISRRAFLKEDFNYFQNSKAMDAEIKKFIGSREKRFLFIKNHFFSPVQKRIMQQAHGMAKRVAISRIHGRPINAPRDQALLSSGHAESEAKSDLHSLTLLAPENSTISRLSSAIGELREINRADLKIKTNEFQEHISHTLPDEICSALALTERQVNKDSVNARKKQLASEFIREVADILSVIQKFEIILELVISARTFNQHSGNIGKLVIIDDIKHICDEIEKICAIKSIYSRIATTGCNIRFEMISLATTIWEKNAGSALTEAHQAESILNTISEIVSKIRASMSLQNIYDELEDMWVHRQKLNFDLQIFLDFDESRTNLDENFERIIRTTYLAAHHQQQLSLSGQRKSSEYLLANQSRLMLSDGQDYSTSATVDEIESSDEEITLEDILEQVITSHPGLKNKNLFDKNAIQEINGRTYLFTDNVARLLSMEAKEWLEKTVLKPSTLLAAGLLEYNSAHAVTLLKFALPLRAQLEKQKREARLAINDAKNNKLKVDRDQDLSYKVFKPDNLVWLCAIITIPFYIPAIILAGLYRIFSFKSIKRDRDLYKYFSEIEKQKKKEIEEIGTQLLLLESEIKEYEQLAQQPESPQEDKIDIDVSTMVQPNSDSSPYPVSTTQSEASLFATPSALTMFSSNKNNQVTELAPSHDDLATKLVIRLEEKHKKVIKKEIEELANLPSEFEDKSDGKSEKEDSEVREKYASIMKSTQSKFTPTLREIYMADKALVSTVRDITNSTTMENICKQVINQLVNQQKQKQKLLQRGYCETTPKSSSRGIHLKVGPSPLVEPIKSAAGIK